MYKILNDTLPPINSLLLMCDTRMIGIVEKINGDEIILLLLDRLGRIKINKSANWVQLSIFDLNTLRYSYRTLFKDDVDKTINDAYKKFEIKYLKK